MSQFYLPESPTSQSPTSPTSSASSDDDLPYPQPLPRRDFLSTEFSPSTYLSTLRNRHQTLEDLRSELRSRSQLLSRELLELVNSHYQDFLNLGMSLKGGEEKIEEIKVGLLGFRKEVGGLRDNVGERESQVGGLLSERRKLRRQAEVGRVLLETEERVCELERRLMLYSAGKIADDEDLSESDDDENDEDEDDDSSDENINAQPGENNLSLQGSVIPFSRLRKHAQQFLYIRLLTERIGADHPFLVAQQPRLTRIRNTLLLDLASALKQARAIGNPGKSQVIKLLGIYSDLDEAEEAIKVVKGLA